MNIWTVSVLCSWQQTQMKTPVLRNRLWLSYTQDLFCKCMQRSYDVISIAVSPGYVCTLWAPCPGSRLSWKLSSSWGWLGVYYSIYLRSKHLWRGMSTETLLNFYRLIFLFFAPIWTKHRLELIRICLPGIVAGSGAKSFFLQTYCIKDAFYLEMLSRPRLGYWPEKGLGVSF